MNIIQVDRPAVSRYHNTRRFCMTNEGVDYDVHDWLTAEVGLKWGTETTGVICTYDKELK